MVPAMSQFFWGCLMVAIIGLAGFGAKTMIWPPAAPPRTDLEKALSGEADCLLREADANKRLCARLRFMARQAALARAKPDLEMLLVGFCKGVISDLDADDLPHH
jgi:hypothetical protein